MVLYLAIDVTFIIDCFINNKNLINPLINGLNIVGATADIKRSATTITLILIVGINLKLIMFSIYIGFFLKNYNTSF